MMGWPLTLKNEIFPQKCQFCSDQKAEETLRSIRKEIEDKPEHNYETA